MLTRTVLKGLAASTAITAAQVIAARSWQKPLGVSSQIVEPAIDDAVHKSEQGLPPSAEQAWRDGAKTALTAVWAALTLRTVLITSAKVFTLWTVGATLLPLLRFTPPLRWLVRRQLAARLLKQGVYVGAAVLVFRKLSRA